MQPFVWFTRTFILNFTCSLRVRNTFLMHLVNLLQLHIQCSSYLIWLPTLLLMTFSTIVMCYCTIVVVIITSPKIEHKF